MSWKGRHKRGGWRDGWMDGCVEGLPTDREKRVVEKDWVKEISCTLDKLLDE
jgi:hypothetical protein